MLNAHVQMLSPLGQRDVFALPYFPGRKVTVPLRSTVLPAPLVKVQYQAYTPWGTTVSFTRPSQAWSGLFVSQISWLQRLKMAKR